jgi:hypothetical protein
MRGALAVSLTLLASATAGAGELIFANGNRLAGELSNEALMVSTGSGLVEIVPDEVVALSREEIRLRDGRVIRGTLVGGQVKARTSLGEIAVKVDELQMYRGSPQASEPSAGPGQTAVPRPAASTSVPGGPAATSATPVAVTAGRSDTGIAGGLPTVAAYQEASSGRQGGGALPSGVQTAVLTPEPRVTPPGRMFEVIGESLLYRDALYSSSRVGRVVTGQQVKYLDSIDRRLRILNLLVFDGGYWVKIRLPDGTEGWVPADFVREVR